MITFRVHTRDFGVIEEVYHLEIDKEGMKVEIFHIGRDPNLAPLAEGRPPPYDLKGIMDADQIQKVEIVEIR